MGAVPNAAGVPGQAWGPRLHPALPPHAWHARGARGGRAFSLTPPCPPPFTPPTRCGTPTLTTPTRSTAPPVARPGGCLRVGAGCWQRGRWGGVREPPQPPHVWAGAARPPAPRASRAQRPLGNLWPGRGETQTRAAGSCGAPGGAARVCLWGGGDFCDHPGGLRGLGWAAPTGSTHGTLPHPSWG